MRNDRIGHAYIFCGPDGIGKRTVARIFAKMLLCARSDEQESCDICPSCRMFDMGTNPDFCLVEPAEASIGVDEIRKIQGEIIIKPLYSARKVYLITHADKMTPQAQNCLLKTLEEPPAYTVIILTTANYDALIDTVRSRAVRCSFKKNSDSEVRMFLEKKLGKDLKGIDSAISYANGVIGAALKLAGSDSFLALRDEAFDVLLKISGPGLLNIFEAYGFFEANRGNIDSILDIMLLFYRDLLIAGEIGSKNALINSDKKNIILNNAPCFSVDRLVKSIEIVETARRNISQNANYQLSIEVMLMGLQEECV